jgi:glycosyltransferase involved in cell wall biosynthesis
MKALLAHPGTQHAFRLARELHRLGRLDSFWSSVVFAADGPLVRILGTRLPRNRVLSEVPAALLHSRPWAELLGKLNRGEDGELAIHRRNERFQRAIPYSAVARAEAVIAFDTSGWLLARRARDAGKPFFLDRTIAHPAVLARGLSTLAAGYPDWPVDLTPRAPEIRRAEEEEHSLATRVVVGSSFARDSLVAEGVDASRIAVNPYGVDWTAFTASQPVSEARPFRFLFAGSILARKGVPVLLDAWRGLRRGDAELWLAGGLPPELGSRIPALPGLRLLGRVPNADMPGLYARADVLVLPSLQEGFSLVLLEALASGLRIIATPQTGAADLVEDPSLGALVECASVESLRAAMQSELDRRPDRDAVRAGALHLQTRYSWTEYGRRWAALLDSPA